MLLSFQPSSRVRSLLFTTGMILALAGWAAFAYYIYITTADPNSSIVQYNQKYYAAFPEIIRGYYRMNLAGVISLVISSAVMFTLAFGKPRIQLIPLAFLVLNGTLICFMSLIGMTTG